MGKDFEPFKIPTFQQAYQNDLQAVFFNVENFEFAVEHDVDGVMLPVIVDNERLRGRNIKDDIEHVFLDSLLFFIESEKLGYRPKYGSKICFDGKLYIVEDVSDYNGYYEILLSVPAN